VHFSDFLCKGTKHTYDILFYHGATAPQWAKASSLLRIHGHTQTHHAQ